MTTVDEFSSFSGIVLILLARIVLAAPYLTLALVESI